MSRSDRFDFLLGFDVCPSLCRELNEINRKHIQDSVALIRKVRSYRHGPRSEIPKTPTPTPCLSLISAGGGSDQEAGEAGPEAAGGAAAHRRGPPAGERSAKEGMLTLRLHPVAQRSTCF